MGGGQRGNHGGWGCGEESKDSPGFSGSDKEEGLTEETEKSSQGNRFRESPQEPEAVLEA